MSQNRNPKYKDINAKTDETLDIINEDEEDGKEEEEEEENEVTKMPKYFNIGNKEQKSDDEFKIMIKDINIKYENEESNYSLASVSNNEEKEIEKKDICDQSRISKDNSNKNYSIESPPYDFLLNENKNNNELAKTLGEKNKGKIIILIYILF